MAETILKCKNLHKKIGKKEILKGVSLEVNEGDILGFIGPNGAGKTTTIKLILGLQGITSGDVNINGYDIKKDFTKAIRRVGAIIENPDLYMYLTGYENLKLVANMYKGITKERIMEVVKLVKLENRINDKVSKYSLGMRQRLGVAQAILHKPNLLVLDEPTNGLDPEGIIEIRKLYNNLIKYYNKLNKIFDFQNPVEIYTLYNKMLYAGYLSKDKEFHFGKDKVKDITTIQGTNIINGEAVCRHIAQMLKDIYLDYGITSYDISVFQKDTTTDKSMLSYYQKELQKVSDIKGIPVEDLTYLLEDKIQEAFSYYISPEDIGKLTNHRITKATYQGKDYYLDPTQTRMYKPSMNNQKILISEDGRIDTKIIPRANSSKAMKANPSTPFSEDLKYVKSTINIYKQNKDILERFYKEHQELYNYISNLLSNIKVKRKEKR